MKNKITLWSIPIGVMIGSLYFFITSDSLSIMGVHVYKLFSAGAFLGSFLLILSFPAKPAKISLLLTVGAEMTVIIVIFNDILKNRTSHNLFPFEVIATTLVILISAFAGAYFAELIKYLKTKMMTKTERKLD